VKQPLASGFLIQTRWYLKFDFSGAIAALFVSPGEWQGKVYSTRKDAEDTEAAQSARTIKTPKHKIFIDSSCIRFHTQSGWAPSHRYDADWLPYV